MKLGKFPLVYLISDGSLADRDFAENSNKLLETIDRAVAAQVSLVQIREKQLSAGNLFELVRAAASLTRRSETNLLVNDRADIALAAGADGVQLTAESLPTAIVRRNFAADFIIGVSAHSLAAAEAAKRDGADFAVFSPIFATPSKARFGAAQGVEKLREVCRKVENFPIVALGGIDETNYTKVLKQGASGVAAIRFFADADQLTETVRKIRNEPRKPQTEN